MSSAQSNENEDLQRFKQEYREEIERLKIQLRDEFEQKLQNLRREFAIQMQQEQEKLRRELPLPDSDNKNKKTRAFLGVNVRPLSQEVRHLLNLEKDQGVLVDQVQPGSPAEQAGIQRMDIIMALEGEKIGDVAKLKNWIKLFSPGQTVKLDILRKGKLIELGVTLGERHISQVEDGWEEFIPFFTEEELKRLHELMEQFGRKVPPETQKFLKELQKKGKYYWRDLPHDPVMREQFRQQLESVLRQVDPEKYREILDELMKGIEKGNIKSSLEKILKKYLPLPPSETVPKRENDKQ